MAVEYVSKYKTSDGRLFESEREADVHERVLIIQKLFGITEPPHHKTISVNYLAMNLDRMVDALYKEEVLGNYFQGRE